MSINNWFKALHHQCLRMSWVFIICGPHFIIADPLVLKGFHSDPKSSGSMEFESIMVLDTANATTIVRCEVTGSQDVHDLHKKSHFIEKHSFISGKQALRKIRPTIVHWPETYEMKPNKALLMLCFQTEDIKNGFKNEKTLVLHINGIGEKEMVAEFKNADLPDFKVWKNE
jgi:hypothetical protein